MSPDIDKLNANWTQIMNRFVKTAISWPKEQCHDARGGMHNWQVISSAFATNIIKKKNLL